MGTWLNRTQEWAALRRRETFTYDYATCYIQGMRGTLAPYEFIEMAVGLVVSLNVKRSLRGAPDPCRCAAGENSSEDIDMGCIVLFGLSAPLLTLLTWRYSTRRTARQLSAEYEIPLETYLSGFPGQWQVASGITAMATDTEIVFVGLAGTPLASMPRATLQDVQIRSVAGGVHLLLSATQGDAQREIVFQFTGTDCKQKAQQAVTELQRTMTAWGGETASNSADQCGDGEMDAL